METVGSRQLRAEKLEIVWVRWGRARLAEARSVGDLEKIVARYGAFVRRWVLGIDE